jgi:hypothetical protein
VSEEFKLLKERADADRIGAIQSDLADYQSKIMQRYGALAALSGQSNGSPLTVPPLTSPGTV